MADVNLTVKPKPQRAPRQRRSRTVVGTPAAPVVPSGRRGRRRRRTRRPRTTLPVNPRARRFVHNEIRRELRAKGLDGPKVAIQQRITSTFGLIGPNTGGGTELELNFFLHPSLAKEANDGTAFGPVQALAAQYALWKLKSLTVKFTPMVGSSAVSGTVVRASLNLSQSPGGSNWSGLGTRLHVDMHPGQSATFHLRGDQVGGPRDGGWWFTDTNEDGSQSAGPIIEIHSLGRTQSTFKDQPWTGPLFLVEGVGTWQFANYQVKPALGQMERKVGPVTATVTADAGQPITLELPSAAGLAAFMDGLEPETYATGNSATVGETIFQIVDVGAKLAEIFAPPPFGWLIAGGWWFVKRVLGRGRPGVSSFYVYASLADAQQNKPAIASASAHAEKATELMVTQINSPNVGPSPRDGVPRTRMQTLRSGDTFRVHSTMISELILSSGGANVPVSTIPGVERDASGNPVVSGATMIYIQTPWWIGIPGRAPTGDSHTLPPSKTTGGYVHALYRLIDPRFTDRSGELEYFPPTGSADINFCVLKQFNTTGHPAPNNPYIVFGKVLATNLIQSGTTPPISMTVNLIRTTSVYRGEADKVRDMLTIIGDNAGEAVIASLPYLGSTSAWDITERVLPADTYLLAVSVTNDPQEVNGIYIPTTITKGKFLRTESPLAPIFPYNLVGQMFASTSTDVTLTYVEKQELDTNLVQQLKMLNVDFKDPRLQPPTIVDLGADGEEWWPHAPVEPPSDDETSSDEESESHETSISEFFAEIGNEMISLPSRWLKHPDFQQFLEMDDD